MLNSVDKIIKNKSWTVKTQITYSYTKGMPSLKWLRFRQKACNMVRTHVKLIVEEEFSTMEICLGVWCSRYLFFLKPHLSGQCPGNDKGSGNHCVSQMEGRTWSRNETWIIKKFDDDDIPVNLPISRVIDHVLRNQIFKSVAIYFEIWQH